MARKLRTIPRCEAQHEAGTGGTDGLPGDDHVVQCSAEATRLLGIKDEALEAATGDAFDTYLLCDGCTTDLRSDIASGGVAYLTIVSDQPVPQEA